MSSILYIAHQIYDLQSMKGWQKMCTLRKRDDWTSSRAAHWYFPVLLLELPAFAIAIVSFRLLNTISRLPPRRAAMAVRDWTGVACLQGHLHLEAPTTRWCWKPESVEIPGILSWRPFKVEAYYAEPCKYGIVWITPHYHAQIFNINLPTRLTVLNHPSCLNKLLPGQDGRMSTISAWKRPIPTHTMSFKRIFSDHHAGQWSLGHRVTSFPWGLDAPRECVRKGPKPVEQAHLMWKIIPRGI